MSKKSRENAHGVEILRREEIFRGFCYTIERLSERLPGGLVVEREVVRHPGAVVILPLLDDGGVVLVEQYRPALGRSLLELPAGTLDPGEDPLATARRELAEETGYSARTWQLLTTFYPAPGMSDERMPAYLATGLEAGEQDLDPGELLEVRRIPLAELEERLRRGEIEDAKSVVALLYLLRFGAPEQQADGEGGR